MDARLESVRAVARAGRSARSEDRVRQPRCARATRWFYDRRRAHCPRLRWHIEYVDRSQRIRSVLHGCEEAPIGHVATEKRRRIRSQSRVAWAEAPTNAIHDQAAHRLSTSKPIAPGIDLRARVG